jgi:energy-coupling factor transport system ATP-binding protein
MIQAEGVTYAYAARPRSDAIRNVDLEVSSDDYLMLCGASGSGKSTLIRAFNGLIPHFHQGRMTGRVVVGGIPTARQRVGALFSQVGLVFQNPQAQLFNRTVRTEMAFGLESLGCSASEIRHRIHRVAEMLGLRPCLDADPQALSGGEQQLVAIAAILALQPSILVLDEPFANLDAAHKGRVRTAIGEIHAAGTGIVVCEHRLAPVLPDVRRFAVLRAGEICCDDPPETFFRRGKLQDLGLEIPLCIRLGRQTGLSPLPKSMGEWMAVRPPPEAVAAPAFPDPPDTVSNDRLIEVEELGYAVNNRDILSGINFTLHRGECLAVVGANGAGKTTLVKHLNGLLRPSRGRIILNGRDSAHRKVHELARWVGMAFQNPSDQFFKLTVREELRVGPDAFGNRDDAWLDELSRVLRLESVLDRAPFRLSGGEKKRVAFAAALAAKPEVLVFDEPTAGQDRFFRDALGRLMHRLLANGMGVVLVTHDLAFAQAHAHRWLVMAGGAVVDQGTPAAVMGRGNGLHRAGLEPTDRHLFGKRHA